MPRTIIHIGMPRTASTFLQSHFFPNFEGFEFYGVSETQYSATFQKMLYQDDSVFNANGIQHELRDILTHNAILSNELFVGQSLYLNATNRTRTAQRLKQFFPHAEIVLVLRNQVDLLQSLYAIGVYAGMTVLPKDFIRFHNVESSVQNPLYSTFAEAENTENYLYSHLIQLYKSLFDKVHVLLFEDFVINPATFAERLSQMLNVNTVTIKNDENRVNKSLSARQIKLIRRVNFFKPVLNRTRLGSKILNFKLRFIEHKISGSERFTFDAELTQKLKDVFKDDNAKLRAMLPELNQNQQFERKYF